MLNKTIFLVRFLIFALISSQKTDCLFVSVGVYTNYRVYGINLRECGLSHPLKTRVSYRHDQCFKKVPGNVTIKYDQFIVPGQYLRRANFRALNKKQLKPMTRIFNGRNARVGESPWTVQLDILAEHNRTQYLIGCTGSLITFEWVLTAAHCIGEKPGWKLISIEVTAGSEYWENLADMNKLFIHPVYASANHSDESSWFIWGPHDIALIKLETKFADNLYDKRNYFLNTICLPNETDLNQYEEMATLSGWGATDINGTAPETLQITQVQLKEREFCEFMYGRLLCAYINNNVNNNQSRHCPGDSGGPLFQISNELTPRAIEIGVTQGGPGNCSAGFATKFYVPTMSFVPWILETVENNTID